MLWKHAPHRSFNFVGHAQDKVTPEPVTFHNSVVFDLGEVSVMVADVGLSERNKQQVVVPKGKMGESIIDELKDRLLEDHVIFSAGLDSYRNELEARYMFVGNGVAQGDGVRARRITKQHIMLALEGMQHKRGITSAKVLPSPEMATVENVMLVASISHAKLNKLQKTIAKHSVFTLGAYVTN